MWLLTKPNLWLKELGSFFSLVMKLQLLINNLGFPFMFMWLKIGSELFCYNYSYNELLIGDFFDNLKLILVDIMVFSNDLVMETITSKMQ
jgi:hypothetical protein